MQTNSARTATVVAVDQIADDGTQWIEVMPTVEKARNGRWYFTVTRDDLDAYAAFIRENGDRIPIDYDHEGAQGGSTRAAGWFTGKAEVEDTDRGPRLRALVRWTAAAVDAIKDGEFRFISPEFSFRDRDARTGLMTKAKELLAATLTNRPFFRELAPVGSELLDGTIVDTLADRYGREAVDLMLAALAGDTTALRDAVTAAQGDVVWRPQDGLEHARQTIHTALNPGNDQWRYAVVDVAPGKALVCDYGDMPRHWIVPFTLNDRGELQLATRDKWGEARQEWVAASYRPDTFDLFEEFCAAANVEPGLGRAALLLHLPERTQHRLRYALDHRTVG